MNSSIHGNPKSVFPTSFFIKRRPCTVTFFVNEFGNIFNIVFNYTYILNVQITLQEIEPGLTNSRWGYLGLTSIHTYYLVLFIIFFNFEINYTHTFSCIEILDWFSKLQRKWCNFHKWPLDQVMKSKNMKKNLHINIWSNFDTYNLIKKDVFLIMHCAPNKQV